MHNFFIFRMCKKYSDGNQIAAPQITISIDTKEENHERRKHEKKYFQPDGQQEKTSDPVCNQFAGQEGL